MALLRIMLCACCRVGKQIVNVPSFMVRVDSQKHIDFALNSPFGGGRPGRNKRRNLKCALPQCSQRRLGAVNAPTSPTCLLTSGWCQCN